MAVNVTASTRCTNESLITGVIPPGGSTGVDSVSIQLQLVQTDTTIASNGNINLTVALTDDGFTVGNY